MRKMGQILADDVATVCGELALRKNILAAYMPWKCYNYEDVILISERLIGWERLAQSTIQNVYFFLAFAPIFSPTKYKLTLITGLWGYIGVLSIKILLSLHATSSPTIYLVCCNT